MDIDATQVLVKIAQQLEALVFANQRLAKEIASLREPLVAQANTTSEMLEASHQIAKYIDDVAQSTAEIAHQLAARGGS